MRDTGHAENDDRQAVESKVITSLLESNMMVYALLRKNCRIRANPYKMGRFFPRIKAMPKRLIHMLQFFYTRRLMEFREGLKRVLLSGKDWRHVARPQHIRRRSALERYIAC